MTLIVFKSNTVGLKNKIKNAVVSFLNSNYSNQKSILSLRNRINKLERSTTYYKDCRATLEREKPDFIFCTNQRPVVAIAPLLAAKDLKIPTATFIFSWDNLPKATMVVQTDFYFVWSQHMKNELLHYHPEIQENKIKITGTPQFESHYDDNISWRKKCF
jgi:UDP-N-acetylglucosamine:LPS N-acetylglucosamine transferase